MRVLIVNTSEKTGGAAVAANRLMEALINNGVKAKMLVRDKETDNINVVALPQGIVTRWSFLWERLTIFLRLRFSMRHLFKIDTACCGTDITKMKEFKEADIIHLHWINQGMLSLKGIQKILASGKPVVWTMHDMWPATGICHLTLGCERFKSQCGQCRLLPGGGSSNDLSSKTWRRKNSIFSKHDISFVTCSKWLANEAKESALLAEQHVTNIPNPIDTNIFKPADKKEARTRCGIPQDKRIILFVSQKVTHSNKGMDYLIEACDILAKNNPEAKSNVAVAILGGHAEEITGRIPFETIPIGYINDTKQIIDIYNAADIFVLPSLSENLPNTIMEAMACGVPCVGFRIGGIPEEIDHRKNGYVAEYRNANDLANGIHWILNEADYKSLSNEAITKVARCYSQRSIALKYIEVYNQALTKKNYRL